jgi:hypothetical protein
MVNIITGRSAVSAGSADPRARLATKYNARVVPATALGGEPE